MPAPETPKLVYDRDCPVCRFYASRVETGADKLELVNAREPGELVDEISAAGIDIDAGMAVKVGDTLYVGSDAVHALALRSSGRGLVNRLAAWLFRSPRRARIFYPPLVRCRNLLLKMLGKARINNLGKPGSGRF